MALQDELATPQGDVDLNRDRQLVERAQSGDGSAFAELYTCYFDRLRRFCVRRLHDDAESHDVAQEAFAKAWRALPSFAGERRFYPWLTVIAANLCTDVLRRRTRSNLTGDFDAVEKLETRPSLDDSIEDRVVAGVENQMALEALDRLSERHRRVLVLREGSGWSYQKIARHEGVEISAIETLLWRARQALKREYAVVSGGAMALLAVPFAGVRAFVRAGRRFAAAVQPHLPFDGHVFERFSAVPASLVAVAGSAVVAAATFGGLAASGSPAPTTVPTVTPAIVSSPGSAFLPTSPFVPQAAPASSSGSAPPSPPPPTPTATAPSDPFGSVSSNPAGSSPSGSNATTPASGVSGAAGSVTNTAGTATNAATGTLGAVGGDVGGVGSTGGSAIGGAGSAAGGAGSAIGGAGQAVGDAGQAASGALQSTTQSAGSALSGSLPALGSG